MSISRGAKLDDQSGPSRSIELNNFSASDGQPSSGVLLGPSGELYGATAIGGASGEGTVFELKPPAGTGTHWRETTLHSFTDSSGDGALQPRRRHLPLRGLRRFGCLGRLCLLLLLRRPSRSLCGGDLGAGRFAHRAALRRSSVIRVGRRGCFCRQIAELLLVYGRLPASVRQYVGTRHGDLRAQLASRRPGSAKHVERRGFRRWNRSGPRALPCQGSAPKRW